MKDLKCYLLCNATTVSDFESNFAFGVVVYFWAVAVVDVDVEEVEFVDGAVCVFVKLLADFSLSYAKTNLTLKILKSAFYYGTF